MGTSAKSPARKVHRAVRPAVSRRRRAVSTVCGRSNSRPCRRGWAERIRASSSPAPPAMSTTVAPSAAAPRTGWAGSGSNIREPAVIDRSKSSASSGSRAKWSKWFSPKHCSKATCPVRTVCSRPHEGLVERPAVHQRQRPHRPFGVRAQQAAGVREPEAVAVLAHHTEHGEVAQQSGEVRCQDTGLLGQFRHAHAPPLVHRVGHSEPRERGQGLRRPCPGQQAQQGFGRLPRTVLVEMGGQDVAVVTGNVQLHAPVTGLGLGGRGEVEDRAVLVRVVAATVGGGAVPSEGRAQAAQHQRVRCLDLEGDMRLVLPLPLLRRDGVESRLRRHGQREHLDHAPRPVRALHGGAQDTDIEFRRGPVVPCGETLAYDNARPRRRVRDEPAVGERRVQRRLVGREDDQRRVREVAALRQSPQLRAVEPGKQEREQCGGVLFLDEVDRRAQAGRIARQCRDHCGGILIPGFGCTDGACVWERPVRRRRSARRTSPAGCATYAAR